MKIVVTVYEKTHWMLRPFAHLFNKYWNGSRTPVDVMCYSKPTIQLPTNFRLCSIDPVDYPREKWGDGLMQYLRSIKDNAVLIMLEDYWITRPVDVNGINTLAKIINDQVLRVDLTTDRLYAGGMKDMGQISHYDLIEAPGAPYQMSLQAGIWNRELLLEILEKLPYDQRSSWNIEIFGSAIVDKSGYRVLGTRQWPLRYINGYNDARGANRELTGALEADRNIMLNAIDEWEKGKDDDKKNK